MAPTELSAASLDDLLAREWLATNGVGGYASSTLPGLHTRKYHGLLVAPMTPPHRRMVLLSRMDESFFLAGSRFSLSCNEYPGTIHPRGHEFLRAFNHDPFPRWAYQGDGWTIEKSLRFIRGQNTVVLCYSLLGGSDALEMELRPLYALRDLHKLAFQSNSKLMTEPRSRRHYRIAATARTPEVFFAHDGEFSAQPYWYLNTIYRRETERGYAGLEDLWSPGVIRSTLKPGQTLHFVCSTDPIDFDSAVITADRQYTLPARSAPAPIKRAPQLAVRAERPAERPEKHEADPTLQLLLRAAEQFVVSDKQSRPGVIATYPWPSPSVRSSLAAFTGLLLIPGRLTDARRLLQRLFDSLRNGLVPSDFPEDGSAPLYEAADTSLWLIKAVDDYLRYSGDDLTLAQQWLDASLEILRTYRRGTALGISVSPDGLIASKAAGLGTSWMDARADGWVVTPRQGKPVELNALWYNALCTVAAWCERLDHADLAADLSAQARTTKIAFNARFWNESARCCYDVIDNDDRDPSIRPNQLFALALPHPVLATDFHTAVLAKVRDELLTPFGLRTLSPRDPAYQPRYAGDILARDKAYHNGTVYPGLLGLYIAALTKSQAIQHSPHIRLLIEPCLDRLREAGQLCELFDGDVPHAPGGAIASARAVGEIIRCYVEDILGIEPKPRSESPVDSPKPAVPQKV